MSGPGSDRRRDDRLFEEAAAWFARMRGPDAQASRAEFDSWLALGEAHRSAYNRAAEIFAMGKLLGEDGGRADAGKTRAQARRLPSFASLGLLAVTLAAALLVLLDYRWHRSGDPIGSDKARGGEVAILSASPGEQRLFRLGDGSLVRLGEATRVEARFTGERRNLILDRGSARFEVAHEGRPFVVLAGGGTVTAHGTIFEVALAADRRVSVRLVEGSIDVRLPASGSQGRPRRLHPGETVSFAAAGPAGTAPSGADGTQPPGDRAAAAPAGAADYDKVPVSDLVAAANRGASKPILLADPRTGERLVSGRFRIDDTMLLAERLALLFNLRMDRSDPAEIVLENP